MTFWDDKQILLTGGAGFLGSYFVEELGKRGVSRDQIQIPRSRETDLRVFENCVDAAIRVIFDISLTDEHLFRGRYHYQGSHWPDCKREPVY